MATTRRPVGRAATTTIVEEMNVAAMAAATIGNAVNFSLDDNISLSNIVVNTNGTPVIVTPVVKTEPTAEERVRQKIEELKTGHTWSAPAQIPYQDIKLFPTHVEVTVKGIKKTISLMDFKDIFDGMVKSEIKMERLVLPANCFLLGRSATEIQLSCYYNERRLNIIHQSRDRDTGRSSMDTYSVPMPNVIISHKLKLDGSQWVVQDTKYLATSKKIGQLMDGQFITDVNPKGGFFHMPFTNFYDDGRMCYGGNSMSPRHTNNLSGLDYYYQVIEQAPFNDDLGIHGMVKRWTPSTWYKHLSKLEKFDYAEFSGNPADMN